MKTAPPKRKMSWYEYAKGACRTMLTNAERRNLPYPAICFVFNNDDDGCESGPFVFATVPRLGDLLDPSWFIGEDESPTCMGYKVSRVDHCEPSDICEIPHIYLTVDAYEP